MAEQHVLSTYLRSHAQEWHSTSGLHSALPGLADRTLRRWLAGLVRDGFVERSGEKRGARYRWVGGVANVTQPSTSVSPSEIFSSQARSLLQKVEKPLYTRSPVTYSLGWVRDYVPNQSFYLSAAQRAELHERGKRPPIPGRAGTYVQKIYNRLLIDLSYNSSRLEGNTYSLADTERLLMTGIGAAGKLKEEQVMILNHKEAIRYLVQNISQLSLNEEAIRTLHYLLADGLVAPELAGQIREDGVLVSGTTYVPLEGRVRLAQQLDELLFKARDIEDPFEQSFFLLGHVSYLQAFVDVNKRVARLTSIVPLIQHDYVPQSFVDADKSDYMKALICFYEFNEVQPLAELYCWSYLRTCQHYDTSVQVLGFDEIAVLYRAQRRALVAEIVRSLVPRSKAEAYLAKHIPAEVREEHREKFLHDALIEVERLDVPRSAGLGIDRAQLEDWLGLDD